MHRSHSASHGEVDVRNLGENKLRLPIYSFLAVLYVVVRNLAPLLPPHVLSRWSRNTTTLPLYGYAQTEKQIARRKRLKSAQRFQCWLGGSIRYIVLKNTDLSA